MRLIISRLRDTADHSFACRRRGRRTACRRRSFRPPLEILAGRVALSTFVVTNAIDHGVCSLREAIERASATPGPARITFDIPTTDSNFRDVNHNGQLDPGDSWSIAPTSALPAVIGRVVIDGWSQGGIG